MTEPGIAGIWVYLSASPLLGLTLTLLAYSLAHRLYLQAGSNPLLNPVLTAVALLIGLLALTGTRYDAYFEGGQYVHFLLGPATVALAVPLYQQLATLRKIWLPVTLGIVAGAATGALSSILCARLLGASATTQLSLAPKSVTAAVAMGISEKIGGLPSLTAVLVIVTGVIGAVLGTRLFDVLRIRSASARGIALGVAAHGIGTARAFQVNATTGAFAGLAMALTAVITAVALPPLLGLVG